VLALIAGPTAGASRDAAPEPPPPASPERGQELEELARERDRFGSVLESLSNAVLALDKEGKITLANRAALALLGLAEPPIGRTLLEVIRNPALKAMVDRAAAGEASASTELELVGAKTRFVLARASREPSGGGVAVVFVDVTEVRRLEGIRRDFAANVSHELRTPVSVIRATADALLDGALDDPERRRGFVEALARHAERLSRLVNDLLDLSRIEAGQYPFEIEPIGLDGVLQRAAEVVEAKARQKRLLLSRSDSGLVALADERALEQIVVNLLDNAVKYTQEGGAVAVSARADGGRIRVAVADNGPGIETRHRERIFERFYRVDPGRSREMGGTGLGLAIVKHLVEGMGGAVGVEPAEPRGSIFWFGLAVAPASATTTSSGSSPAWVASAVSASPPAKPE
jgi:two-component system phosphate regulon sensor histidine kinase PhoR